MQIPEEAVEYASILFHIGASSSVLLADNVQPLRQYLRYGKTLQGDINRFPLLARLVVPKTWFAHFYALLAIGSMYNLLSGRSSVRTWILLLQGCRRFLEQRFLFDVNSKARMHIGHWMVGLLFYIFELMLPITDTDNQVLLSCAACLFVLGSMLQASFHRTLAHTTRYNMPHFWLTGTDVACPHYGAEMVVYLSLYMLSGFSSDALPPLIWVIVSLAASGRETRNFYWMKSKSAHSNQDRSPEHTHLNNRPKWAICPYLY